MLGQGGDVTAVMVCQLLLVKVQRMAGSICHATGIPTMEIKGSDTMVFYVDTSVPLFYLFTGQAGTFVPLHSTTGRLTKTIVNDRAGQGVLCVENTLQRRHHPCDL